MTEEFFDTTKDEPEIIRFPPQYFTPTQEVICGDARELFTLEDIATCDAMLVDPPYSRYVHTSARSASGKRGVADRDFGFDHLTPNFRHWIARAAASVRRWSVIYSDVQSAWKMRLACQGAGARYVREPPWIRWSMPNLAGNCPPQGHEALLIFHNARGRKSWNGPGNLVCFEETAYRGEDKHKAEKPLDQALNLVSWFTRPGETVIDPCAGSGTIGLACRLLGRSYVGAEIQPYWADFSNERISRAELTSSDADRFERWAATVLCRTNDRFLDHDRRIAQTLQISVLPDLEIELPEESEDSS